MRIPPELEDLKYYFGKLSQRLHAHEEWLASLQVLSCEGVLAMAERILMCAEEQMRYAMATHALLQEMSPQPPEGTEPEDWQQVQHNMEQQTRLARDLREQADRLAGYVRRQCSGP